jgi:hypothetical protein
VTCVQKQHCSGSSTEETGTSGREERPRPEWGLAFQTPGVLKRGQLGFPEGCMKSNCLKVQRPVSGGVDGTMILHDS